MVTSDLTLQTLYPDAVFDGGHGGDLGFLIQPSGLHQGRSKSENPVSCRPPCSQTLGGDADMLYMEKREEQSVRRGGVSKKKKNMVQTATKFAIWGVSLVD